MKIQIPNSYTFNFRQVEGGFELDFQDAETYEVFFTIPKVFLTEQEALSEIPVWLEKIRPASWDSIRAQRNQLLTQSDWTQLADAPLTQEQKNTWAAYRQALRDVPSSFATPEEVVWPTTP